MSLAKDILGINESIAPHGASVEFEGIIWKKGSTDQPTWFPMSKKVGYVIPMDDEKNFNAIEKKWKEAEEFSKRKTAEFKAAMKARQEAEDNLSPEDKLKLQKMEIEVLKAPLGKRDKLIKKIDKFLGF